MPVVFVIPGPLRGYSGGRGRVEIEARPATVAEALQALWHLHPAVRDRVLDERGEVRPHVNLFVNGQNVRFAAGLDTVVPAQAEISILPAVSGGAGASQEVES